MTVTKKELRNRSYPQAEIDLAETQREAERRAGARPRSLAEVLGGRPARPRPEADPVDLTSRQLRRRGRYGQAALLVDQEALREHNPARAAEARDAAVILKGLASKPAQTEFDFFMSNANFGHEYHDAIRERLWSIDVTQAERAQARSVLVEIIRWLAWQDWACQKTAAELAALLHMNTGDMARTLQLLERVGAVYRVKRGRTKIITVNPEGAYRGDIKRHAEACDSYRKNVWPLRVAATSTDPEPPAAA